MHGKVVRTLSDTMQIEVEFEAGQKYWVPYDRVDFKEKEVKPKMVVENEYGKYLPFKFIVEFALTDVARQYITKAKEPIPSRSIPVPGTTPKRAAPKPKASRPPIDTRPQPVAGPSRPLPMAPPIQYPHLGSEWQSIHPRHPAYPQAALPPNYPYGDPRIANRVVVCDSTASAPVHYTC